MTERAIDVPDAPRAGEAPRRLAHAASTDGRLLARSSLTLVSRGFAKFAQIIFLVVAARMLSVEEFAGYSYLIVLASAFTVMSDTGVPLVAGRDASAGRAHVGELFAAALPVVLASALVAAGLLPLFGALDSGPGSTLLPVLVAAAFVVFNRFFDLVCQLLRGMGRFALEAALQSAGAVAFIAGGIVVVAMGGGVTAVLLVLCLKELVSGVVGYVAIRPELRRPRRAHRSVGWRDLVRIGIRLTIAGVALALATRIPLTVLGNTGTPTEVALFSAAQRFGDGAYVVAISGGFALVPGIAYLAAADAVRARRLLWRVLIGVLAASAALSALAIPFGEPIMRLVFGSDFAAGADLFRIIVAGLAAYSALGVCWYAIVAFDGEARLPAVGVTALMAAIALSALLIPRLGDEGAAWAYLGSLCAAALVSALALWRQLRNADR